MFSMLLRQRLHDFGTIGPRDLGNCGKAARYWTAQGWREHPSKQGECDELRNMANFQRMLVADMSNHPSEV